MPVKIRLQRKGRKKAPFYHIVVANSRDTRDGRFIERLGSYNPLTKPATIELDGEKALEWLFKGAQPTDTARAILRYKGVYYHKHLKRGVAKGAMTEEQCAAEFARWSAEKEAKIDQRVEQTKQEKMDYHKRLFGTPAPRKVVEAPAADNNENSEEA